MLLAAPYLPDAPFQSQHFIFMGRSTVGRLKISQGHRLRQRYLATILAIAAALLPCPATCASFYVNGVTFSDKLGGFILESVTGQGSLTDPFVVVERMTSRNGGILLFRATPTIGNQIGSFDRIGFALVKVIENGTGHVWSSFELELQSILGVPSDNRDELSFGQGSDAGRPFTAMGFARVTIIDEPYDRIEYEEGNIPPGGRAVLRLVISQPTSLHEAYLAQRPSGPVASLTARPSMTLHASN
jgi:hypothetical protein